MASNRYDVVVIGAGLAGFAAACAAIQEKLKVALVAAGPGSFALGSEWPRLESAAQPATELTEAFTFFRKMAQRAGCPLTQAHADQPLWLPTLLGGFAPFRLAPARLAQAQPVEDTTTVIVGVRGLVDFDADFLAERLNEQVKPLHSRCRYVARQIMLAGGLSEPLTALRLAQRFDRSAGFRAELLRLLRTIAAGADCLLLPGMLGVHTSEESLQRFEQELSCAVGEVSTLPPSVPGLRLANRLERFLHDSGVELLRGFPVDALDIADGICTGLTLATPGRAMTVRGESIVLASGRRSAALLGAAFARLDAELRPAAANGAVLARNLYVAGSLVKPGADTALLTGYRAGKCAAAQRGCYAAG